MCLLDPMTSREVIVYKPSYLSALAREAVSFGVQSASACIPLNGTFQNVSFKLVVGV